MSAPKVGDMLDKASAVRGLPVGSTVRGAEDQVPAYKVGNDTWYFANGFREAVVTTAISLPAKVLEIGGDES